MELYVFFWLWKYVFLYFIFFYDVAETVKKKKKSLRIKDTGGFLIGIVGPKERTG